MSNDFSNRVVIVTGGTRGIGKGLSLSFLKSGARVIATYASNDDAANSFRDSVGELSSMLTLKKFDVANSKEVDLFWNEVLEEFPKVDILVNNSGIRKDNLSPVMPDEDWDRVIDINLSGSFYMTKRAVKHFMSNRYGRIINMSSIGGVLGLPGQANYAASKAGQIAMTKTISKEVGKKGITINNVCPGFIDTELISDLPAEQVKEYKKSIPVKRFGTVDDVSHAVLFLASEKASYITGTSIEVTGGL